MWLKKVSKTVRPNPVVTTTPINTGVKDGWMDDGTLKLCRRHTEVTTSQPIMNAHSLLFCFPET